MWSRGLLITGSGASDLTPLHLMRGLERDGFFTVMTEDEAARSWPNEAFDVVMVAPGCKGPAPVLRRCFAQNPPFLVLGCPRLDAESSALLAQYRARGGRALGPGSQGFFDWEKKLALSWSPSVRLPDSLPDERHVVLIAQGGAVPFSLYAMAVEAGVRFRRVLSLGNCCDSDEELFSQIRGVIADPHSKLLILCLESLSRGREFLTLTAQAAARHLPVVLLRAGASERLRERMANRHPDGAWTDQIMWDSVAGQYGVVLLDDAQQIVDLGKLAALGPSSRGRRVAVLSTSEGLAALSADQCTAAGLDVSAFSQALKDKIQSRLPSWTCVDNPADLSSHVLNDEDLLSRILADVRESGECDMILVTVGVLTPRQGELLSRALVAAHHSGLPLACCCLGRWRPLEDMVRRLNAGGVPLFSSPRRVAEAMASLWRIGRTVPAVSEMCPPAARPVLDSLPRKLSERDAMQLVEAYGLKTVPHILCTSVAEVIDASRALGFPLALKVVSPSFASKQQSRAVALNLKTEEELRNAYGRILERVSRVHAEAEIQGVVAQKMITDGIECMIGIKRDPLFGAVVAVALGGAFYGLVKDIALRVAPVSAAEARGMIESLKGYPLISGQWFGRPNDVDALAGQIAALSEMACAEPDIEVLDINPIFVRPLGLGTEIADAFAVRRSR